MSRQCKKSLVDVVKTNRKEAGLSIRNLALKIGVSNQQISRWENEKDRIPLHRATAMANACGVRERDFRVQIDSLGQTVDYESECKSLLTMMDQVQLESLHSLLLGLIYK